MNTPLRMNRLLWVSLMMCAFLLGAIVRGHDDNDRLRDCIDRNQNVTITADFTC